MKTLLLPIDEQNRCFLKRKTQTYARNDSKYTHSINIKLRGVLGAGIRLTGHCSQVSWPHARCQHVCNREKTEVLQIQEGSDVTCRRGDVCHLLDSSDDLHFFWLLSERGSTQSESRRHSTHRQQLFRSAERCSVYVVSTYSCVVSELLSDHHPFCGPGLLRRVQAACAPCVNW